MIRTRKTSDIDDVVVGPLDKKRKKRKKKALYPRREENETYTPP
jgi:hypothetical protein